MTINSTLKTLLYSIIALNTFNVSPIFAQEPNSVKKALAIGDDAPSFVLKDLSGEYIFLRDYTGKKLRQPWKKREKHVVVLSFFATWCIPCRTEIPILGKIAARYKDELLLIYLLDLEEKAEKIIPFIEEFNVSIPVLLDEYGVVAKKYGMVSEKDNLAALPQLFLIDKEGTIRYLSRGLKDAEKFHSSLVTNIDIWLNVEN